MVSFKRAFSLSSFTFTKRLFSSSLLSAIRVVASCISEVKETLNMTNTVHLRGTLIKKGKKFSQVQCFLLGMWRLPKEILIQ